MYSCFMAPNIADIAIFMLPILNSDEKLTLYHPGYYPGILSNT